MARSGGDRGQVSSLTATGAGGARATSAASIQGGYLYLEGRRDDMIISGGINIMPARVEEVLLADGGVAECAVVGVPSAEWARRCRPSSSAAIRRSTPRRWKATSAPATCRPISARASIRSWTELPRTSTNKVLRRVLRETALDAAAPEQSHIEVIERETMSETEKLLLIERQCPVAIVTINRPDKRNALNEKLWGELKTTFESFEPDVRCVVLAGAGKHFCAGLDLAEHRHRQPFVPTKMLAGSLKSRPQEPHRLDELLCQRGVVQARMNFPMVLV